MKCTWLKLEDGSTVIVCGGRRFQQQKCACGATAVFLCDWKVPDTRDVVRRRAIRQPSTCSTPLCPDCAYSPTKGKHLCTTHKNAWLLHPSHPRQQKEDERETRSV